MVSLDAWSQISNESSAASRNLLHISDLWSFSLSCIFYMSLFFKHTSSHSHEFLILLEEKKTRKKMRAESPNPMTINLLWFHLGPLLRNKLFPIWDYPLSLCTRLCHFLRFLSRHVSQVSFKLLFLFLIKKCLSFQYNSLSKVRCCKNYTLKEEETSIWHHSLINGNFFFPL